MGALWLKRFILYSQSIHDILLSPYNLFWTVPFLSLIFGIGGTVKLAKKMAKIGQNLLTHLEQKGLVFHKDHSERYRKVNLGQTITGMNIGIKDVSAF
jgi:hypothetical protein